MLQFVEKNIVIVGKSILISPLAVSMREKCDKLVVDWLAVQEVLKTKKKTKKRKMTVVVEKEGKKQGERAYVSPIAVTEITQDQNKINEGTNEKMEIGEDECVARTKGGELKAQLETVNVLYASLLMDTDCKAISNKNLNINESPEMKGVKPSTYTLTNDQLTHLSVLLVRSFDLHRDVSSTPQPGLSPYELGFWGFVSEVFKTLAEDIYFAALLLFSFVGNAQGEFSDVHLSKKSDLAGKLSDECFCVVRAPCYFSKEMKLQIAKHTQALLRFSLEHRSEKNREKIEQGLNDVELYVLASSGVMVLVYCYCLFLLFVINRMRS
jgi:hypothetical protein